MWMLQIVALLTLINLVDIASAIRRFERESENLKSGISFATNNDREFKAPRILGPLDEGGGPLASSQISSRQGFKFINNFFCETGPKNSTIL